jgi:DNA-binding CsgD family transcriptional regulator
VPGEETMLLNSLRLAFDLLCLASGLSGILLAVLVYMRTPSRLIANHAFTLGVWTLNQVVLVTFFYLNGILNASNPGLNAALNDACYLASGVFAALLIRLLHAYFRRKPSTWMTALAISCALTAFIPASIAMWKYPDLSGPLHMIEAVKLILFYGALYAVAWYLWRAVQNVVSDEIRRVLQLLVVLQVVFYPLMLWEGSGFFDGHFFAPVSFFSLFYGIINLTWLFFVSRHIEFPMVQFINSDRALERFTTLFEISEREREIVVLLLDGYSYREIAERLFIANETVKTHVTNIYRKAGVRSKMELAKAVRNS